MSRLLICPEFCQLADFLEQNKTPITHPFELPANYLKMAYHLVVEEGNIQFDDPATTKAIIIQSLLSQDDYQIAKTCKTDFTWRLFDDCVRLCQEHQLHHTHFYLRLPKAPIAPSLDNKESLSLLTVEDIKSLLKTVGQKQSGKRDELVDRLWVFLPIEATERLLNAKYNEQHQIYQTRLIHHKYELLASFIKSRAYCLRKLVDFNSYQFNPFAIQRQTKLQLGFKGENEQDKQLAKLLDGTGYDTVLVDGVLHKLLPLFPYDFSWVYPAP